MLLVAFSQLLRADEVLRVHSLKLDRMAGLERSHSDVELSEVRRMKAKEVDYRGAILCCRLFNLDAPAEAKLDQRVAGCPRGLQSREEGDQVGLGERHLIEVQVLESLLHYEEAERHLRQVRVCEPGGHVDESEAGQVALL